MTKFNDSKPLVIVSVEDIYEHAKQLNIKLSKAEAIEIYDEIDTSDWDCENYTFWAYIEELIRQYKRNNV